MVRKLIKEFEPAWNNARLHVHDVMCRVMGDGYCKGYSMEQIFRELEIWWEYTHDSKLTITLLTYNSFVDFHSEEEYVEFILKWS